MCVDAAGKIWTWGFGGYGRLGHKVQRDEWTPKMVEIQGGDRNLCPEDCVVGAAQTCSWVTALMGQMYCWGKIKTTGDNHMYPVPFLDLQGWNLRSVACGATTFAVCGETEAVTWGSAGGCGELGYGPKGPKSLVANPKIGGSMSGKMTRARWRAGGARCSSSTRGRGGVARVRTEGGRRRPRRRRAKAVAEPKAGRRQEGLRRQAAKKR